MEERSMVEAVRLALQAAMRRDDRVMILGEDVGRLGGVFRATDGLLGEFGEERVVDMPMSEQSIVGISIGLAVRGMRPIAEIQFADFIYAAAEQILCEAARYRFRTAGEWHVPLVIRTPWGAGIHGALYHSQSIEAVFCHFPGLKVVAASTAADAAGLLLSAIDDPDPVIVLEHKLAYRQVSGPVADPPAPVPIGPLRRVRPGTDATVIAYGWMVHEAERAAEELAADGFDVGVVDLRTLLPLDREGIAAAAAETGRVCVVHEAVRTMGLGAEIAATVQEACFESLAAPVRRVTMPDVAGIPFADSLERALIPDAERIAQAVRELCAARPRATPRAPAAATAAGAPYHDGSVPQASMVMTASLERLDPEIDLVAYAVYASARALVDEPDANGEWTERGIRRQPAAHIAVVENDGGGRSRTIVVPNAEELSPRGIERHLERARRNGAAAGAARPTFTLIVAGEGALFGVPRVPAGQVAAVQVGAPHDAAVALERGVGVRREAALTLSADHRVLDGAGSARFLAAVRRHLEEPV